MTVSQWADQYRKLSSEASAEPGQWRTSRAPYQKGIMDAYNDKTVEQIVVMSSAQGGKTEIINNIVGYIIDQNPGPILLLQPTLEMAETWSKDRLAPMVRDTEVLIDKIRDPRSRDSGNTMKHKTFPGGHITMAGANSPAGLASRPIRDVLCDEVDRYPVSAGTEGDPVNLAAKRTTTFWNSKLILTSTPTTKDASRIEFAYEASDMRRYHVPCPHCKEVQHLKWSNIIFNKEDPVRTTRYACVHCGSEIDTTEKLRMLRAGDWVAENEFRGVAGFHLNELYSPWRKWSDVVVDFLQAKQNSETLKTWVNTSLGETWEEEAQQIDEAVLMARREVYEAEAPRGVLCLVMAVDVQDDRLEAETIGYGYGDESWGVEYRVLHGNPDEPEVWRDLDAVLAKQYQRADGAVLNISTTTIDSGGHHTSQVYDYCKKNAVKRVHAIIGRGGAGRPLVSAPTPRRYGKAKRPVKLFTVGVDTAKTLVYSRLQMTDVGPGFCHFPEAYTAEYFAQLTAEKVVTKYKRGFPYREWVQTRPRNEALDIRGYALAALALLNPIYPSLERLVESTIGNRPKDKQDRPARPSRFRFT